MIDTDKLCENIAQALAAQLGPLAALVGLKLVGASAPVSKKGPGRPKKAVDAEQVQKVSTAPRKPGRPKLAAKPGKRGPGRPKKVAAAVLAAAPKRRGRPPKAKIAQNGSTESVVVAASQVASALEASELT